MKLDNPQIAFNIQKYIYQNYVYIYKYIYQKQKCIYRFQEIYPEIYLLDLKVQYKHKIKLPRDMVSKHVFLHHCLPD